VVAGALERFEELGLPLRYRRPAPRDGPVHGACWSKINLETRLWTIPAERMKAGKEHRVPLSTGAMAIVAALELLDKRVVSMQAWSDYCGATGASTAVETP
jgi:integrase